MEVFGLGVVLMLNNKMSVDDHLGPATVVDGVADCLVHCYQNVTCSGVFYNDVEKHCFSSLKVHITPNRLVAAPGVKHYGFTAAACPYAKGYTYFRGAQLCIKRISHPHAANNSAAELKCREDGGRLARPRRPIHQIAMFSSFFGCLWIGGYRDLSNDTYWWSEGDEITYTPWQPLNPTASSNRVNLASCEIGWKNFNPISALSYMCEIPFETYVCPP